MPVLFSNTGASVSDTQKLVLSCESLVLERLQQVRIRKGMLAWGDTYKIRVVDLEAQRPTAQTLLNELTGYLQASRKPRLWLNSHCRICRYQPQCKAQAVQADDLSLLNRMSEREIQVYQRKGISTVKQLSYTFRFRKRGIRVKARGRPHSFPLQALALREQSVFVVSAPVIPKATTRIYLDMEGSSSGSSAYLIGMLIVTDESTRFEWFWAETKDEEEQLYDQFLQYLASLGHFHLFFYGSYEARVFRRIAASRQPPGTSESLLSSATNVLSLIYASVYFPTYSNELKEIGKYLGCEWSSPDSTGLQAIAWRAQWEDSHDLAVKDRLILTTGRTAWLCKRSRSSFRLCRKIVRLAMPMTAEFALSRKSRPMTTFVTSGGNPLRWMNSRGLLSVPTSIIRETRFISEPTPLSRTSSGARRKTEGATGCIPTKSSTYGRQAAHIARAEAFPVII